MTHSFPARRSSDLDRFVLVFRRLESVLRERHPLLLGEVAIHQILGRDGDLADAILTEFLAVPAAENPEGRQDEAAARYACQEQPLLPSNRLVPGKVARKRRDALARPTIEGRTLTVRSEAHTSELQSLMRISSAVFCLTKHTK